MAQHPHDQQAARLDARELGELTPETPQTLSAELLGIDDPLDMYFGEIVRVPLLAAEEEVVLAKAIELGEQIAEAPWQGILQLFEWTRHDTERMARTRYPQYRLPYGPEAERMVRAAVAEEAAAGPLVAAPDFPFDKAAEDAQSDGTKALLVEARHLTAACNETRTPDAFVTLLDFGCASSAIRAARGSCGTSWSKPLVGPQRPGCRSHPGPAARVSTDVALASPGGTLCGAVSQGPHSGAGRRRDSPSTWCLLRA